MLFFHPVTKQTLRRIRDRITAEIVGSIDQHGMIICRRCDQLEARLQAAREDHLRLKQLQHDHDQEHNVPLNFEELTATKHPPR